MQKQTPAEKPTILIVEDERDLLELLHFNLTREGYRVLAATSGERALDIAADEQPDLILLDLMLPGIDGLEVCRTMRSDPQLAGIPIVMVTAKGEESDVVAGLEIGADDYVTKPFSPRVLLARVKATLRSHKAAREQDPDALNDLRLGPLRIRRDRHEVLADGERVDLTRTEFGLLTLLAARPGRVFTRQQIIQSLHGDLAAVTDRSVDVQIVSLRRKLGELGEQIETVRGIGYRYSG